MFEKLGAKSLKKYGTKGQGKSSQYGSPVLIISQTPTDKGRAKFQFEGGAKELLGLNYDGEDLVAFDFTNAENGQLSIVNVTGTNYAEHADKKVGKMGGFSSKPVHGAVNKSIEWIDTTDAEVVCSLTLVENEEGISVAALSPYTSEASNTTPEEPAKVEAQPEAEEEEEW